MNYFKNCRYGLPQAGMMFGPVTNDEIQLLGKIFDNTILKANISNLRSPNPLVIFCRNSRDQVPMGDSLPGLSTKFCNDFFPSPTHTGTCITKNLDVEEIIHLEEEYKAFFEAEEQTSNLTVGKENYWAISTFIINALKTDPTKVYFVLSFEVTCQINLDIAFPVEILGIIGKRLKNSTWPDLVRRK